MADAFEEAELAEVIGKVRADLEEAQRRGQGSTLRFKVSKVSLELAVQVRREGGAKGGLRIGVLTAELAGGLARDQTHRIQVELEPHGPRGHVDVGGEDDEAH